MATNKTIAPTGVTVQIPGLTDAPDMSVPANAIDKAIDGINTLNSQTTYKAITNEYSSVLDAINAYRNTQNFPFTINKSGSAACSDIPTGVANTCEWNALCFGSPTRITVYLTLFTGASSNNGKTFVANIYNGSYNYNFAAIG